MRRHSIRILVACFIGFYVRGATADVIEVSGSTGSPPSTLGPYGMTAFPADSQPLAAVSEVPTPVGGDIVFSPTLTHATVGNGWGSWGNGYSGDVYKTTGTEVELTLPVNTFGVYFYVEPFFSGSYEVTATAPNYKSISSSIATGDTATYFGFYGTGGDTISTITVSAPGVPGGFAVGEFGIDPVPEPSTLLLLAGGAAGLLCNAWRQRRRCG